MKQSYCYLNLPKAVPLQPDSNKWRLPAIALSLWERRVWRDWIHSLNVAQVETNNEAFAA
jgi:hypothetical protein